MRELMRSRDFRLLFAGQTLSMYGDTAMLIVLAMWAKTLTHSNGIAGSVFAALAIPSLIAPLAGVVIDRFRRRTVMIVTDLLSALVVLCLLFVHGRDQLWLIYVVAFLYGASLVTFQSARSALLTTMLPDEVLGEANGSLGTVREALRLVGPVSGAGLFALWGGHAVAALDAATFLLSAISLSLMRLRESHPVRSETHFLHEATAGARHLLAVPVLRVAVVGTVICMLVIGISESVYFAVIDQGLHKPVSFLGVLGTIQGVGAIAAGLTITALIRRTGELRPVAYGLGALALGVTLTLSSNLWVVCAGVLCFGAGLPVVIVCITTIIQRRTPGPMQGRVFTAFEVVAGGPQLLSIVAGAILVTVLDYHILIGIMACGLLVSALYAAVKLREPAGPVLVDETTVDVQPAVAVEMFEQPAVVGQDQQRPVVGP
jgi:MFS family permease